jgi:hypothetical protein
MNNKGYKKSETGTEPKSGKKRKAPSGVHRLENLRASCNVSPTRSLSVNRATTSTTFHKPKTHE